ncbi:tetratricopeptide repeat protein [Kitasatospora sp. HPMI-4]|uniref:tetratricopeptide repeat protein n=1 Tax=Kitasatospora sp. HPMI-4 TaxID=3448443 RepID=UPI003F1A0648
MSGGRSWQDLIRGHQKASFIGRHRELEWFRENLRLPVEERRFILSIHGTAGVGKSYLLDQLRQGAEQEGQAVSARVDEGFESLFAVVESLGNQLVRQGLSMKAFRKQLDAVRQQREQTGDVPADAGPSPVSRIVAGVGLAAAQSIPVVGPIAGMVSVDHVAEGAHRISTVLGERRRRGEDLGGGVETMLTSALLEGLRAESGPKPVLLCFDTYELLEPLVDSWLRALVGGRYGEVPAETMLVVSGQRSLDTYRWAPFLAVIASLPLEVFTEAEARQYLASRQITDAEIVSVILALSGRLPVLVATLAQSRPQSPDEVGDPSGDAVQRFLKWEPDTQRRNLAIRCALPRTVDHTVLDVLHPDVTDAPYLWLRSLPFVRESGAAMRYHQVVRDAMIRYQRIALPSQWELTHRGLANRFGALRAQAAENHNAGETTDVWRRHRLEELYHLLCADGAARLPEALAEAALAADLSRREDARAWAQMLLEAGVDSGHAEIRRWGQRLLEAWEDTWWSTTFVTALLDGAALEGHARAAALSARARARYLQGQYPEAAGDSDQALASWPGNPRFLCLRSEIHAAMGQFPEAALVATRSIELAPNLTDAYIALACAELGMNHTTEALTAYSSALEVAPENETVLLGLSTVHSVLEDMETALSFCERALAVSESASSVAERAEIFAATGRSEEAKADVERALSIDRSVSVLLACADVQITLGRTDLARALAREAEQMAPDQAGTYVSLSWIAHRCGQLDDAETFSKKAIDLAPYNPEYASSRGTLMWILGHHTQAVEAYDRALQLRPDWIQWLTARGCCHELTGDLESTFRDFSRVAELEPQNVDSKIHMSSRLIALGRYAEALDRLADPQNETADHPWIHGLHGWTLHCQRRETEALAQIDQALAASNPPPGAWSLRGWIHWELGNLAQADEDFTTVIDSGNKPVPWTMMGRAIVRCYRGRYDQAETDFGQAITWWLDVSRAELARSASDLIRRHRTRNLIPLTEILRTVAILSYEPRWPDTEDPIRNLTALQPSADLISDCMQLVTGLASTVREHRPQALRSQRLLDRAVEFLRAMTA